MGPEVFVVVSSIGGMILAIWGPRSPKPPAPRRVRADTSCPDICQSPKGSTFAAEAAQWARDQGDMQLAYAYEELDRRLTV